MWWVHCRPRLCTNREFNSLYLKTCHFFRQHTVLVAPLLTSSTTQFWQVVQVRKIKAAKFVRFYQSTFTVVGMVVVYQSSTILLISFSSQILPTKLGKTQYYQCVCQNRQKMRKLQGSDTAKWLVGDVQISHGGNIFQLMSVRDMSSSTKRINANQWLAVASQTVSTALATFRTALIRAKATLVGL